MPRTPISPSAKVLHFIDDTIENISLALESLPPGEPCIVLRRPSKAEDADISQTCNGGSGDMAISKKRAAARQMTYRWPGNSADEAWRFCKWFQSSTVDSELISQSMHTGNAV